MTLALRDALSMRHFLMLRRCRRIRVDRVHHAPRVGGTDRHGRLDPTTRSTCFFLFLFQPKSKAFEKQSDSFECYSSELTTNPCYPKGDLTTYC